MTPIWGGVLKWEERFNRIHWENIILVAVIDSEQPPELIDEFFNLPYNKKVLLSTQSVMDDRVFCLHVPKDKMWYSKKRFNPFLSYFDVFDYKKVFDD